MCQCTPAMYHCGCTVFMGPWAQRPDCSAVDEPLYGHWLHQSGAHHPMREQVIALQVLALAFPPTVHFKQQQVTGSKSRTLSIFSRNMISSWHASQDA